MVTYPDVIKSQINNIEPLLQPRVSEKWITAMKSLENLIEAITINDCLKIHFVKLNPFQLTIAIGSLCTPSTIIKNVIVPALNNNSMIVRHEALSLLLVMVNQIKAFLTAAKIHYNNFVEIKNNMMDYIMKTMPNLNVIFNVWMCAFESHVNTEQSVEENYLPEPSKQSHLEVILSLLHVYNDICPELLDVTLKIQQNVLLSKLNELHDIDDNELVTLKIKAIQFLLMLNSLEFVADRTLFNEALVFLLSMLETNSSNLLSVKTTIKMVLNKTSIFEGCSEEIDIWINGLLSIDDYTERTEIIDWLVNIIKITNKHTNKYINIIIQAEETTNDEVIQTVKLKNILDELHDKQDNLNNVENKNSLYIQPVTSISPILCCALCQLKKISSPVLLQYISYILIHSLHHQVTPGPLIQLTIDIQNLPVQKYLCSWCETNPVALQKIFPSMHIMRKVSKALLKNTNIKLTELFSGNKTLNFKYENQDIIVHHSLSPHDVITLIKMSVFYLVQNAYRNSLNDVQYSNYKIIIMFLLHVASTITDEYYCDLFENCTRSILTHPLILQYFSLYQKHRNTETIFSDIVLNICCIASKLNKTFLKKLLLPYKNKVISQIEKIARNREVNRCTYKSVIDLLEQLQLDTQDIAYLLTLLSNLPKEMFIAKDKSNLSVCGYLLPKLFELSCYEKLKFVFFESANLNTSLIKKVCSNLIYLKLNNIKDIDEWEIILQKYLSCSYYNIATIFNTKIFATILTTKITPSTVELISFLISRNQSFMPLFMQYATQSENVKQNDIIFPIMQNNLHYEWKEELLQKLNDYYKNEILYYISHPENTESWIGKYPKAISHVINKTFDLITCKEVCNSMFQIGDKLHIISLSYLEILQSVYYKYATLNESGVDPIMDLIQVLLHIITLILKKESKNTEKMIVFYEALNNAIERLKEKESNFVFENLTKNNSWSQFVRLSLKSGLKLPKGEDNYLPMLKTLSKLCDIAYKDESENEFAKIMFEMTVSHSEFINIMLTASRIKEELLELVWILLQKNKSVMSESHIALYLAAYNCTLNNADQLILQILQCYANSNIKFNDYRPYLWGDAAAEHYNIKSDIDTTLWRQPSVSKVLSLFDKDIIENTIRCYPIHRKLKNQKLHDAENVYDPAFYLPLLCYLLSENNVVPCYKIMQSGALALTLMACSSNDKDIRLAAFTVISRYYFHLEASNFKDKLLWMHFIDALRNGIISVESSVENIQLNCLVSTFLAKMSLIASQPLHPLYLPLYTFLMAKPALDINTIPELLQLFHSSDMQYKTHRHWILEIIRDGIKMEKDVEIIMKCMIFKMLPDFFNCTLCDEKTKKFILEIVNAATKYSKLCLLLIREYGLLSWFMESVIQLEVCDPEHVEIVINIVNNFLNALLTVKVECDRYKFMLLKILLYLKIHFKKGLQVRSLKQYLILIKRLLEMKELENVVTRQDIIDLIDLSQTLLRNVNGCEDVLEINYTLSHKEKNFNIKNEIEIVRNCLQELIQTWYKYGTR